VLVPLSFTDFEKDVLTKRAGKDENARLAKPNTFKNFLRLNMVILPFLSSPKKLAG